MGEAPHSPFFPVHLVYKLRCYNHETTLSAILHVIQNITNIQKMVSITVFSMMLVVLCIGTAVGAPTKRQSSDDNENGLDMNRAIIMLQKVATKLMKSSVSIHNLK